MYYLLAGALGFLLCGAWFGTQLWLKQLFSRRGREGLVLFAPLLAACPPMLLLCWKGLYGPQGPALPQLWLWLLSGATVLAVCGIRCLGGRKGRTVGRRELAWELLSSLAFSLGCGYVFYRSGRLLFSAAAHAAERFLVTKLDR